MMKIRQANKFDIPQIIELLWHYHASGVFLDIKITDDTTAKKLLSTILAGAGVAVVSEHDNKLTGMILGICTPFLWDNKKLIINEIAYWVDEEYRGGSTGYRLLKEYTNICNELKKQNKISFYTISQMEGTKLNYEKFGFRPIESIWSQ